MLKFEGGSLIIIGVILIVVGVVLRWDLVQWLIGFTGLILIIIGIILGVIGLANLVLGGGRRSRRY